MNLYNHQKLCLDNIEKHFENDNKGLIKMFCGSGKSYIIYKCLIKYGLSLSVVVVPSINLITQFNKDYLSNITDFELLSICSKNELNDNYNFTTDEDYILEFLQKEENKIILITYASLETLINIIKDYEFKIDLICFDEAHHILSDGMKNLLFGTYDIEDDINDINNDEIENEEYYESFIDSFVNKTLFFTATPKNSNDIMMYESITGITINDEYYDIEDDENSCIVDEPHCGKMIYEYMHINGVNDNILNDFNIKVDMYVENTDTNIFEAISRTILETGNNRVLTFHSRSYIESEKGSDVNSFTNEANIKLFQNSFNKVLKNEFPNLKKKYKYINFNGITSNTKNKLELLQELDETKDNEIYVLASCKTIGEGVDTRNANMVCFVDPKQSYVEIIQNIGRVCRKNENTKQKATILIPAFIDVNKYKDCKTDDDRDNVIRNEMSKTGDFYGILNVLSALRQEDPYMFELCLNSPDTFTNKELKDNLKKNKLELDETEIEVKDFDELSKKLKKNIIITSNNINEEDVIINNNFTEYNYFVKNGDKYMKVNGSINKKIDRPNRNIKPDCHTSNELKVLWSIDSDININKNIFSGYIKSTVKVDTDIEWIEKIASK